MDSNNNLPYDPTNEQSIIEYAQLLVGSTLREHIGVQEIDDPKQRKGSFGNAIEHYYFKYDINSDSNPDFAEVGIELKTTPLKKTKKGDLVSKERLVISMINYMEVVNEDFETSTLLHKAQKMLLMSYLYEKEKDPLDYDILVAVLWGLPEEDMLTFKQDWETIVNKIRAGKAHELSGSDTLYLEACTKAANSSVRRPQPFSDIPAKPRAWALKNSYMTAVSQGMLDEMQALQRREGEEHLPLLELVRNRFEPFFGKTETELAEHFGYRKEGKRSPKNICALITKRILGVEEEQKIAEFEKAGIKPKTIRVQRNGKPKESISFPTFDYIKLAETSFEDSDFKEYLDTKYLFVLYRASDEEPDVYRLSEVMFWQMPDSDLEEAQRCYTEMQKRVREGRAEDSVKSSENRCCHVRPHGRNSQDTSMTPYGVAVTKKCFWLNSSYIAEEIAANCL